MKKHYTFRTRGIKSVLFIFSLFLMVQFSFAEQGFTPETSLDRGTPIPAGYPTASTTGIVGAGIDPGDLTSYSGTYTIDGLSDTVVELLDISGFMHIKNCSNVIVRHCRIIGSGDLFGIRIENTNSMITIEYCELGTTTEGTATGISTLGGGIDSLIVRNCDISGGADGMKVTSNNLIEGNYIHHLYRWYNPEDRDGLGDWTHNDCLQTLTAFNVKISGNTLLGPYHYANSTFQCQTDAGSISNITIEDNYLSGGGNSINIREKNGHTVTNLTIRNNLWEDDTFLYGPYTRITEEIPVSYGNSFTSGGQCDIVTNKCVPNDNEEEIIEETGVSLNINTQGLLIGESFSLIETVSPDEATYKSVSWSSDNEAVATVDENGVVTAVSEGSATITVTTNNLGYTDQCAVTVIPAGSSPSNVALNKPVSVSDENLPGDPKEELVDGDELSYWATPGLLSDDQWAEIDLQGSFDLSSIELITHQSRDYQYIVEASSDGVNYSLIVDRSANTEGTNLVDAVSVTASYVKITVSGANTYTGDWCSLKELIVMGEPAPVTRTESLNAETDDRQVNSNGSMAWVGQTTIRVGGSATDVDGCAVFPFALPALEAGESIASAQLNVSLERIANSPEGNVDVYALPYRSSSTVLATDFWQGDYATDPNSTSIQNDFATLSAVPGTISLSSEASVSLADYINAQFAAGAQAGDYIFIRLNPDYPDVRNYFYWSFYSANSANVPSLDLEIEGGSGPAVVLPTGITLSDSNLSLNTGQTEELSETIVPANATEKSVSWTSDNTSVATVDQNGNVTAIGSGTATITAQTVNGLTATCSVSVTQLPTSISIDPTVLDLIVGAAEAIQAKVLPAEADDKSVSWASSNNNIASVDASGNISALAEGTAIITATTNAGGLTAQCTVNITDPVIIDEDFASGASDFTVIAGGTWAVSGERYVLSNPASGATGLLGNISVHNTVVTGDFELSTLLNITGTTSTWNDAAVIFNYQDANNFYYVSLNETNDSNTKGIFKVENGTSSELADINVSIADDTDYVLEISKAGSDIVVKLDGTQIASATDATFSNGKVGYGTKNDGAQYDDLLVISSGSVAKALQPKSNIAESMSEILIYPNPNPGDNVFVEFPVGIENANIMIYDINGKLILQQSVYGEQHININLSNKSALNKGMYLIEISTPMSREISKLIVR